MSDSAPLIPIDATKLTLRDKIDWSYLLATAIHTMFHTMRKDELRESELDIIVEYIESLIPSTFYDEQYKKDLKNFTVSQPLHDIPRFGGVTMNPKVYWELTGNDPNETIDFVPTSKKFRAILDQLNRLGVIMKKDYVEKFTGLRYKSAEDLEKMNEEQISATLTQEILRGVEE